MYLLNGVEMKKGVIYVYTIIAKKQKYYYLCTKTTSTKEWIGLTNFKDETEYVEQTVWFSIKQIHYAKKHLKFLGFVGDGASEESGYNLLPNTVEMSLGITDTDEEIVEEFKY